MKRFGLSLLIASATLFHAADLRSQESMQPPPAGESSAARKTAPVRKERLPSTTARAAVRQSELLKRYDRNGDGRIDEDERVDAKEEMLKENLDRQMARITATQANPEQVRARVLELFDRNKDGQLDDDECALVQKFAEERTANPSATSAALREQLVRRFDKNANGRIEPEERAEVAEFLRQRAEAAPKTRTAAAPVKKRVTK